MGWLYVFSPFPPPSPPPPPPPPPPHNETALISQPVGVQHSYFTWGWVGRGKFFPIMIWWIWPWGQGQRSNFPKLRFPIIISKYFQPRIFRLCICVKRVILQTWLDFGHSWVIFGFLTEFWLRKTPEIEVSDQYLQRFQTKEFLALHMS